MNGSLGSLPERNGSLGLPGSEDSVLIRCCPKHELGVRWGLTRMDAVSS